MEEADKVPSSAPDEAPHDVAMNEAAAVGPTQTDARDAEEEMPGKTSPPQTTEKTSDTQTNEITSVSKIDEETSSSQTTEVTSASKIAEGTSSSQTTEVTNDSPPLITEVTNDSPPQITEITNNSPPQITEVNNDSPPQTNEVTSSSQTTEVTSVSKITEETSIPQTNEVNNGSPPQTTEVTSASKITEETSPPQITEVNNDSPPQITEVNNDSPPLSTEVTSSPEPAEERVAPVSEVPVKRTSTEAGVTATDPVSTEAAVTPEPAEESVTPPVSEAVTPATELTPPPRTEARDERVSSSSEEKHHPLTLPPSPSHEPELPAAPPALFQPHLPSDRWDSPSLASTMDPLGFKDPAGFDPDVLSQSDDDFMFEPKKALSPLNDNEVSDSPSPDLVQDAHDGDEGQALSESREIQREADPALSEVSDDRPMSLPDILKSSPMNPEKVDSGSSEGSPEFSPVHRSVSESPNSPFSVSANNLLGLDSKVLLLKEMAEVTEARIAEQAKLEEENQSEPSLVALDLVKETDGLLKDRDGVETSAQTPLRFECLNFPLGKAEEHWDSESPSADSFSPVLEQRALADEGSEPSSEDFEFVERPPRGDEFLETQDSPAFPKPSEELLDEERSSSSLLQASDASSTGREKAGLQELSPTPPISPPADEPGPGKQEAEARGACPLADVSGAAALQLLYWRDVRSSALVFSSSLFLLLSLTCCSIISVLAYSALTLLSITLTFRIYKGVLQAVQKSDEGHPFKCVLERDVCVSSEALQRHSEAALGRVNGALKELRRLFLVEDLIDSLKLAALLWVCTYVGAWFNGLTLLILGLVSAFSGPLAYERHQCTQIDQVISGVSAQLKGVMGRIQAMVPGAKKKPE